MSTPRQPSGTSIPETGDIDYRVLRSVSSYAQAQQTVDQLSDRGFAVEKVRIVGLGLRTVEQVTGRLTTGKATGQGAIGGAWFGLLVGLLFAIFTDASLWAYAFFGPIVLGAVWGAIFSGIGHAATGGRRDFSAVSSFEADSYDILVEAPYVQEADETLRREPAS